MWFQNRICSQNELSNVGAQLLRPAYFYASKPLLEPCFEQQLDFIQIIKTVLVEFGYVPVLVNIETNHWDCDQENALHFWMSDVPPAVPVSNNLFYTSPLYIRGFWTLNQEGLRHNTNIRKLKFEPSKIPDQPAHNFYQRLQTDYYSGKLDKYEQSDDEDFRSGAILFAIQDLDVPDNYPIYLNCLELLDGVIANRNHRPVWIKPHPDTHIESAMAFAKYHDPDKGIYFENCNLHDALQKCEYVVTRCSAIAIEALIYAKRAIVSGQVDYGHVVETVRDIAEIPGAMSRAQTESVEYEKYLFWFFKRHCFEPAKTHACISKVRKYLSNLADCAAR